MRDTVPARVVNLHRVRAVPLVGLTLAALLGAVVLAFALALGARVHRHDLAILRALGLSRRGSTRVLAWQGAALAAAILVVGIPLGVLVGSLLWHRLAHAFGIGAGALVGTGIATLVPATFAIAVVASLLPARQLRKDRVGVLLRTE